MGLKSTPGGHKKYLNLKMIYQFSFDVLFSVGEKVCISLSAFPLNTVPRRSVEQYGGSGHE